MVERDRENLTRNVSAPPGISHTGQSDKLPALSVPQAPRRHSLQSLRRLTLIPVDGEEAWCPFTPFTPFTPLLPFCVVFPFVARMSGLIDGASCDMELVGPSYVDIPSCVGFAKRLMTDSGAVITR
jgi:hypothetical protein